MALRSPVHYTQYKRIHVALLLFVVCPMCIDWRCSPLTLDSLSRIWSLLSPWLRVKDVEPPVPLNPYQGGAAPCSPWPAHSVPLYSGGIRSFRYEQEDIWASPCLFLFSLVSLLDMNASIYFSTAIPRLISVWYLICFVSQARTVSQPSGRSSRVSTSSHVSQSVMRDKD